MSSRKHRMSSSQKLKTCSGCFFVFCGIGFLLVLIGLGCLIYWRHLKSNSASLGRCSHHRPRPGLSGLTINGTVYIDGTVLAAQTDDDFICATLDWWPPTKCDYGTCSWGTATILTLDLNNNIFLNAVKAFSPLKIRMGGTLQDRLVFETPGDPTPCTHFIRTSSEFMGFTQGCLPMSRWDELNSFFQRAGAIVVFGLNALHGRLVNPDRSIIGAWNSSNAESLIRYTVNKGYSVLGWELGNEVSGNYGIGASIPADQYASDVNTLTSLVQRLYDGHDPKPLILAPGGFFEVDWFSDFLARTAKTLQVATHHIYNLGPGVDDRLVDKILDPSCLDGGEEPFRQLDSILKSSGSSAVAWVGEAGGAYNSGRHLVTNTFVFSFWYLDQLGMAAKHNTKTYCRQSLIGGNYGLLNTSTFEPNPDYYSALLWHRLMGSTVLPTSFVGADTIRAYCHCSKNSTGITLLLINLDGSTVRVQVSTYKDKKELATYDGNTREEYHFTPKDGDLQSQVMLLNGNILSVNSSGIIPSLDPVNTKPSDPITVGPFSIVFARIPGIDVPVCK